MRAKDIMTTNVATASSGNSVRRAVQIMLEHGVSGLPVIDDDARLVGIISEGDLLRRSELGSSEYAAAMRAASAEEQDRDFAKGYGGNVADVMTTNVVTVAEDAPLGRVAALMEEHGIKRVPVMRKGRLVGIVSRADLLRAIATAKLDDAVVEDTAIRQEILARLCEITGVDQIALGVTVSDGIVHLWGIVDNESERDAARVAAEGVSGTKGVYDHLRVVPGVGGKAT
jgi:CBS domain-containing protein